MCKWQQLLITDVLDYHNTNLIEMTNRMQLCGKIYYYIVP
jgi:hypothetical protein